MILFGVVGLVQLPIPRPSQISSTTICRCTSTFWGPFYLPDASKFSILGSCLNLTFITSVQNAEPPATQIAAALFQELCYSNKDQLSAGIIIAGYDKRHGGEVYSIPLGGSLHKQRYAIGGSGSTYIYGYCDSNWKENFTEGECIEFVKGALSEAVKWDGSSGGVIRMVVLTDRGAERKIFFPDEDYKGVGK